MKRPALTTLEVLAGPVRARRKTHLITGYVHRNYPRIYALLARAAGYSTALLVRGVEGGVIPSLREEGKCFIDIGGKGEVAREIRASEFGLAQSLRPLPIPSELLGKEDRTKPLDANAIARSAADAGRRALAGEPGPVHDHLIAAGALCLHHLGRYPTPLAAADAVRGALANGSAARRLRIL